jgi:DNA topoisomerase-1
VGGHIRPVPRLRRSNCNAPGLHRQRRGRGFRYVDASGTALTDPAMIARIDALAIPPAWQRVWICPWPNGHIQATGFDAAGRRQYRYHEDWRKRRDQEKHQRILLVAERLPEARARFAADLEHSEMTRAKVLAVAARLLDLGLFRVGSEEYAEDNGTYGLTTLRRDHVSLQRDPPRMVFDYIAKSGKHRVQSIADITLLEAVGAMRRRRSGPPELLAYKENREWRHIDADDVNAYLREVFGACGDEVNISAKDFRTWHATVLMAVALAVSRDRPASDSGRSRVLARAYQEVAHYLGNTPAVCRSSYVDPRIVDLWDHGQTIRDVLDELGADTTVGQPATQGRVERAVLSLLSPTTAHARAA